jgi:hypothetical protein
MLSECTVNGLSPLLVAYAETAQKHCEYNDKDSHISSKIQYNESDETVIQNGECG